jgi:bifunctional non-homologous end joining protein LigD
MLAGLTQQLDPLERETSPFGTPVPPRYARGAHWVEPRLVAEVAFTEWTAGGSMRHPSWHGLRLDKDPGRYIAKAKDCAATASKREGPGR